MKKLQFLIACIFLSSGVFAADWLSAGKADDEEWLVNKRYTQQGSLRNVTWMRNFTYEGQKMSQKIVDSMDCSKKQSTTVSVVLYKGHNFSGSVVPYKAPSIGKVTNIDINKVGGYAYELFCPSKEPKEPLEMVWRLTNPSEPGAKLDFFDSTSCREMLSVYSYHKPGWSCKYVPKYGSGRN
jgi:hypothetical protein